MKDSSSGFARPSADETESGKIEDHVEREHDLATVAFLCKEEYRGLVLRFIYGEDYGIYRVHLDGKNVLQSADTMAGQEL